MNTGVIQVQVFDEKTESWILLQTVASRWEDKFRELQYIRFHDFTAFYGNEYPIFEGVKE